MEWVVNVISNLVKSPKPTYARKYLLKTEFNPKNVSKNTHIYKYTDYMTFL